MTLHRIASSPGPAAGLGLALATALAAPRLAGVVLDGRDAERLARRHRMALARDRAPPCRLDVADPAHRAALVACGRPPAAWTCSSTTRATLGPSPLPRPRATWPPRTFARVLAVNRRGAARRSPGSLLPALRGRRRHGGRRSPPTPPSRHYEGWGGYGAGKAALDHLVAVLAAEEPGRARGMPSTPATCARSMHQDAFPGEDISDRPLPETVVPAAPAPARPSGPRAAATGPPSWRCRRDRPRPTVRIPSSPRRPS